MYKETSEADIASFRKKKKMLTLTLSAALASSMIMSSGVVAAQATSVASVSTVTANPTSSKVLVNNEEIAFQAYTINGNNYFKLRDIAMALKDTNETFAVGWDNENSAISLESGKPYVAEGGELAVSANPSTEQGILSDSAIYLNGKKIALTAYTINGNNYFKLRDLADALNIRVMWDAIKNTIAIVTTSGFVPEPSEVLDLKIDKNHFDPEFGEQLFSGDRNLLEYGQHNYGIHDPSEYKEVMKILHEKVKDLDSWQLGHPEGKVAVAGVDNEIIVETQNAYRRYLDGARPLKDYKRGSEELRSQPRAEQRLWIVHQEFKPLFELGVSQEEAVTILKLGRIATNILRNGDVTTGSNSLADLILRGEWDCDPEGYLYSALFDIYGYNTAVITGSNHASGLVEINGEWRATSGGTLNPFDLDFHKSNYSDVRLLAQPTFGGTL